MKIFLFPFLLLASSNFAFSQTSINDPKDAEGWYSATIKFDMPKKWQPFFQYEARFYDNLRTYYGSYLSFGTSKNISKKSEVLAEYRMSLFRDATYHRFSIGAQTEKKLFKKCDANFRLLLQNRVEDYYEAGEASQQSFWWRARAGVKYKITKDLDAYASLEPIMEFGGEEPVNNWRNTIGLKYKIYKNTKLDVFYIYNPDYGKKTYNRTFNILGVNMSYTFSTKSKNKKSQKKNKY